MTYIEPGDIWSLNLSHLFVDVYHPRFTGLGVDFGVDRFGISLGFHVYRIGFFAAVWWKKRG